MEKWKYRICSEDAQTYSIEKEEELLNSMGDNGWELSSILEVKYGDSVNRRYYFKKKLSRSEK